MSPFEAVRMLSMQPDMYRRMKAGRFLDQSQEMKSLNSLGTLKMTCKYGIGSVSAIRSAIHVAFLLRLQFGQSPRPQEAQLGGTYPPLKPFGSTGGPISGVLQAPRFLIPHSWYCSQKPV